MGIIYSIAMSISFDAFDSDHKKKIINAFIFAQLNRMHREKLCGIFLVI